MTDVVGQRVYYHGSHKSRHGAMTVESKIVGDEFTPYLRKGEERFILVYGNKVHNYLTNVRRESFTLLSESQHPTKWNAAAIQTIPVKETAHQRLSRMFNIGKYGEELAQEILDQYILEVSRDEWINVE